MSAIEHLSVRNLSKRFGQVVAVDSVSLSIGRGELHCLLGENGAGKSTLSECLYGFYTPDAGQIFLNGHPVEFKSPRDALSAGIGMVHQNFVLVPSFSVVENIVLGTSTKGWSIDLSKARSRILSICSQYDITVDLDAELWQLSVGEQQWVEILKALYTDAEILILDEPTAVLTPQESDRLFAILRRMTRNNLTVILITHKLKEVLQSDRVTVLRKGKFVGTVDTKHATTESLVSMMLGRSPAHESRRTLHPPGDTVLSVSDLVVLGDRGTASVCNLTFEIRAGEILGIAGVAGNGQRELFEAIVGARKVKSGQIELMKTQVTNLSPADIIAKGLGYIPDDRYRVGLIGEFSIEENLILGLHKRQFSRGSLLDFPRVAEFSHRAMKEFGIVASSSKAPADTLSGGNAQKIILARELTSCTSCLLANQPSRGLDVGVKEYVHQTLLTKRSQGFAILLASEELDDILLLSDRIAVMFKGQFMGVFRPEDIDVRQIGLLMAGQSRALH